MQSLPKFKWLLPTRGRKEFTVTYNTQASAGYLLRTTMTFVDRCYHYQQNLRGLNVSKHLQISV